MISLQSIYSKYTEYSIVRIIRLDTQSHSNDKLNYLVFSREPKGCKQCIEFESEEVAVVLVKQQNV